MGPKPKVDRALAEKMLAEGVLRKDIAKHFGVTKQAISALFPKPERVAEIKARKKAYYQANREKILSKLKERNLALGKTRKTRSKLDTNEIKHMIEKGMNQTQIAKHFGVTKQAINSRLATDG